MTTSGTTAWNPDLQHIIQQALLNVGAISEDEEAGSPAYYAALRTLNGLVKSLEATGLHVWTETEAVLFLQVGVGKYVLGGSAPTAHATDADSWLLLTLANAAAPAATTITVEDATGVSSGDHIGVVLASGVTQWTTVNGAPAADVITLTAPLDEAANAGDYAISYTTQLGRPLKVPAARLLTLQGLLETPMTVLSRQGYMDLPQKTSPGTPTQWFYSPQRDTGLFYVWPVMETSAWAVRFTAYRSIEDFLIPTNTADMPQEWVLPLIWNLSLELATSYGVPDATYTRISAQAEKWAMTVISYDRESEPIEFGMDAWRYGG